MARSLTFKAGEKLKKRSQFRRVYKQGQQTPGRSFKLVYLENGLTSNRIGFSVEARKVRLSTRRTRIKRLLREAYRQNKAIIKKGFDMVLIASPGASKLDFEKANKEFLTLFRKAGLSPRKTR